MIQHVDAALIVGCYVSIIALYVWVFKAIQEIKDMVNKHANSSEKHTSSHDLVFRDVCAVQVKRFEERIDEVKVDVCDLKSQINTGFHEVKALIKDIRKDA